MSAALGPWLSFLLAIPGWSVIHFAWQALVLGGLLEVAFLALRRASPRHREQVAAFGLALLAATFAATGLQLAGAALELGPANLIDPVPATAEEFVAGKSRQPHLSAQTLGSAKTTYRSPASARASGAERSLAERGGRLAADLAPWIGGAWLVGAELLLLRLCLGARRVRRIRRNGRPVGDPEVRRRLERIAARLGVRRPVLIVVSTELDGPALIGWRSPTIVLPATALRTLESEALDAALAHELAHVHRGDALARAIQLVTRAVLFHHPLVHRLVSRLEREREQACDDLAIDAIGSRRVYARTLARLERMRHASASLALAADGGPLLQRIRRIVEPAPRCSPALARAVLSIALGSGVMVARTSVSVAGARDLVIPPIEGLHLHRGHDTWKSGPGLASGP